MSSVPRLKLLGALLLVAACSSSPAASPTAAPVTTPAPTPVPTVAPTPVPTIAMPDKLVIGFVPSTDAQALVDTIQPLADYLTQQLGIPVTGYVSADYTGMVTAMKTGQAQIGALPPFGMVQAIDQAGADVILQSVRFGSNTYHTQFFTNNPDKYCTDSAPVENTRVDSNGNDVTFLNCNGTARANDATPKGPTGEDALKNITTGTTVSFVEESSSSGYIFPATELINAGFDINTDITELFAGSHNASVIAVCEGQAEVGVSFDDARTSTTTDCDMKSNDVVFAYGPEIPNDGIAVSGDLPDSLKAAIKQALLDYVNTPDGAKVLNDIYQITGFADPDLSGLNLIRDAVKNLGYSG
jgi:phosphonate transport system substrate-binding protein